MRITSTKGVDRQFVWKAQKRMDAARAMAAAEMKELRQRREAVGAKKGEGRVGGWHREAVMNAIASEGPEVLGSDAKGYWDDMKRLYPEMSADGAIPGTDSVNGHVGRMGKVKEKYFRGKWWYWDKRIGDWVEGEITKRKGIK